MRLGDIAKKSSLKLKMISEEELVDLHKVLLLMLLQHMNHMKNWLKFLMLFTYVLIPYYIINRLNMHWRRGNMYYVKLL